MILDDLQKPLNAKNLMELLRENFDYTGSLDNLTFFKANSMLSNAQAKIDAVKNSSDFFVSEQSRAYTGLIAVENLLKTWIQENKHDDKIEDDETASDIAHKEKKKSNKTKFKKKLKESWSPEDLRMAAREVISFGSGVDSDGLPANGNGDWESYTQDYAAAAGIDAETLYTEVLKLANQKKNVAESNGPGPMAGSGNKEKISDKLGTCDTNAHYGKTHKQNKKCNNWVQLDESTINEAPGDFKNAAGKVLKGIGNAAHGAANLGTHVASRATNAAGSIISAGYRGLKGQPIHDRWGMVQRGPEKSHNSSQTNNWGSSKSDFQDLNLNSLFKNDSVWNSLPSKRRDYLNSLANKYSKNYSQRTDDSDGMTLNLNALFNNNDTWTTLPQQTKEHLIQLANKNIKNYKSVNSKQTPTANTTQTRSGASQSPKVSQSRPTSKNNSTVNSTVKPNAAKPGNGRNRRPDNLRHSQVAPETNNAQTKIEVDVADALINELPKGTSKKEIIRKINKAKANNPAAAQSFDSLFRAAIREGKNMKPKLKESVIKTRARRMLAEGEMENAQAALAAKDLVDRLQDTVEELGKMSNEELPHLIDAIRTSFGPEKAEAYQSAASEIINALLDSVKEKRAGLENATLVLTGDATEQNPEDHMDLPDESDEESNEGDQEVSGNPDDFSPEDFAPEPTKVKNPLGRETRGESNESKISRKNKVAEDVHYFPTDDTKVCPKCDDTGFDNKTMRKCQACRYKGLSSTSISEGKKKGKKPEWLLNAEEKAEKKEGKKVDEAYNYKTSRDNWNNYGIRYVVYGRSMKGPAYVTKEKYFETAQQMSKFESRLRKSENFKEVVGHSYPKNKEGNMTESKSLTEAKIIALDKALKESKSTVVKRRIKEELTRLVTEAIKAEKKEKVKKTKCKGCKKMFEGTGKYCTKTCEKKSTKVMSPAKKK